MLTSIGYDYDDDMLAAPQVRIPPREQSGIRKPAASPHLIGRGKGLGNPIAMFRQQIGMSLGDMPLALRGKLNFAAEVRACKGGFDRGSSSEIAFAIVPDRRCRVPPRLAAPPESR